MSIGILNYNILPRTQWPSDMIRGAKKLSHRFEMISYEQSKELSSSFGKVISTSRCVLNILAHSSFLEGTHIANSMGVVAKKAKILSFIGIPFGMFTLQSSLQKTTQSFDIDDREGVLVNSLGVAATSADMLYAVSTVTNAFLDTIGKSPIQIFTDINLPICFFMSGIDVNSRILQLSKASKLYQEIDPASFLRGEATSMDDLRRRLQRRLGIRQEAKEIKRLASASLLSFETLQQRQDAKLERMIPKNAKEDIKDLLALLKVNGKQPLTKMQRKIIADSLQKVRTDLEQKMAQDTVLMIASVVGIIGLTFFCMHGMGCLPYVMQMIAAAIKASAGFCVDSSAKLKQS